MHRPIAREYAYSAIDKERNYQDAMLGNSARETKETNRDLGALILLTDAYLGKVKAAFAGPSPEGRTSALDQLRKVAALAVLAMELHGVEERK